MVSVDVKHHIYLLTGGLAGVRGGGGGVIRLFLTRHTPQDNAVLVVSQRVASNPLQASPRLSGRTCNSQHS